MNQFQQVQPGLFKMVQILGARGEATEVYLNRTPQGDTTRATT